MLGHEYAPTAAPTADELETQRIDAILGAFDTDRRSALRILSGPLLGALHTIRLERDETIPEADATRLLSTLAELTAAVDNLLRYQTPTEAVDPVQPAAEVAA